MLAIKPQGTYLHDGFLPSILAVPRSLFPASDVLLYAPLDPTRSERNLKSCQCFNFSQTNIARKLRKAL